MAKIATAYFRLLFRPEMLLIASASVIPSVAVIFRSVSSVTLYSPRSTAPMYVRCRPHSNAKPTCNQGQNGAGGAPMTRGSYRHAASPV